MISIDIPNYSIHLEVSDEEIARRRAAGAKAPEKNITGYLKRYSKLVSSADRGAIVNIKD